MENVSFWEFFRHSSKWVKLRLGFLGSCAVLVVLSAGTSIGFILNWSWQQSQAQRRQLASIPVPKAPSFTLGYEIKEVSLALTSRNLNRTSYAQFTLVLDCPTEASRREMELNRAKLLDGIFEVGADFHLEDFANPAGFKTFKKKLEAHYQNTFGKLAPRDIALNDWLLQ